VSEDVEYSAAAEESRLRVRLGASIPTSALPVAAKPVAVPAQPAEITVADVSFERRGSEDQVRVELNSATDYRQRQLTSTQTRLQLTAAILPEERERALDVRAFGGAVKLVSTYSQGASGVWIDVEHAEGAQARVHRSGNALVWTFFDGP